MDGKWVSDQPLHRGGTGALLADTAGGWDAAGIQFAAGGCERSAESCGAAAGAGACGEACGADGSYAADYGQRSFCAVQIQLSGLSGKVVSNTDPQFDGKVVIVAIGGSWCPNCHDEAPFLESLYKQFHGRGLEIVNLSFEEGDQLKDPERLRAFIARYGLTYTVLVAGDTDQLNEKIPQAVNLNCWPTSFFLGRDGRVREVHAGFAGPANPPAHEALMREVTELVERLLAEPVPAQNASLDF